MITDLVQRRISKRKDRFNPAYLLYLFIFVPLLLGVFFPQVDVYLGEDVYLWILIIIILVLSLGINAFQWRAWHNRWREFAAQMGLQYQSYKSKQAFLFQWPRIDGTYHGNALQIERFTKGSGRYKKIYTSISMHFRDPVSNSLVVIPKRLTSGLRRSLARDNADLEFIEIGDELFDRKVEVKASSMQFARDVLSSHQIQQGLVEIRGQTRDLEIQVKGTELNYQERSNIMDLQYLTDVLNFLAEFMGYIERSGR
jgi:hypothetical protein